MATNATWTVVMDDKLIIKAGFDNGDGTTGRGYTINEDSFGINQNF